MSIFLFIYRQALVSGLSIYTKWNWLPFGVYEVFIYRFLAGSYMATTAAVPTSGSSRNGTCTGLSLFLVLYCIIFRVSVRYIYRVLGVPVLDGFSLSISIPLLSSPVVEPESERVGVVVPCDEGIIVTSNLL